MVLITKKVKRIYLNVYLKSGILSDKIMDDKLIKLSFCRLKLLVQRKKIHLTFLDFYYQLIGVRIVDGFFNW